MPSVSVRHSVCDDAEICTAAPSTIRWPGLATTSCPSLQSLSDFDFSAKVAARRDGCR